MDKIKLSITYSFFNTYIHVLYCVYFYLYFSISVTVFSYNVNWVMRFITRYFKIFLNPEA